jgi:hypothetical protein
MTGPSEKPKAKVNLDQYAVSLIDSARLTFQVTPPVPRSARFVQPSLAPPVLTQAGK